MTRGASLLAVAAVLVLGGLGAPSARATEIRIDFAGVVTQAEMDGGLFGPSVSMGDPFTGYFTYELEQPDQEPGNSLLGLYDATAFVIDGATVAFANPTIEVAVGAEDTFTIEVASPVYQNGIGLFLLGASGTLGFDWLPAELDLADFQAGIVLGSTGFVSIIPEVPSTLMRDRGELTELPEPGGAGALAAFAALAVRALRRG